MALRRASGIAIRIRRGHLRADFFAPRAQLFVKLASRHSQRGKAQRCRLD
jgi:hypothetical protein